MPLPTLSPADFVACIHPPERIGQITLVDGSDGWQGESLPRNAVIARANQLVGKTNIYLSMQSFFGGRANKRLAQFGALYADIDFHKTDRWRGFSPQAVASAIRYDLADRLIPEPSFIMFTGRGLLVLWLHNLIPAQALPRWRAVEQNLVALLEPYGADPAATDPARVFRLCGTRNGKSGKIVQPLHIGRQQREGVRLDFEELAAALLPRERPDRLARQSRAERATRAASGGSRSPHYTGRSYWAHVWDDLNRVRQYRWGECLPSGQRDNWLFIAGIALSWLQHPAVMETEIIHLADQLAGWSRGECRSHLAHLWRGGASGTPHRYHMRAATIVARLGITEAEMHQAGLRILVTPAIRRKLATQRQAAYRRRHGQIPVTTYRAAGAARRAKAWDLRAAGHGWGEIARQMGLASADAARMLAKRHVPAMISQSEQQPSPNKTVPVYGGVASSGGLSCQQQIKLPDPGGELAGLGGGKWFPAQGQHTSQLAILRPPLVLPVGGLVQARGHLPTAPQGLPSSARLARLPGGLAGCSVGGAICLGVDCRAGCQGGLVGACREAPRCPQAWPLPWPAGWWRVGYWPCGGCQGAGAGLPLLELERHATTTYLDVLIVCVATGIWIGSGGYSDADRYGGAEPGALHAAIGLPFLPLGQHPDTEEWLYWCPLVGRDGHCTDHQQRPAVCRSQLPGAWGGAMPHVVATGQPFIFGDEVAA